MSEEGALYRFLLLKSLLISAVTAFVVLCLAFPLAYFIAFHVRRSRLTWILLVTVPFWISYLLRIFSWKVVLGFGGALNSGLIGLGLIERPIEALLYNQFAVVLALAHSWSAFCGTADLCFIAKDRSPPDGSRYGPRRFSAPALSAGRTASRHAGSAGGVPSRVRSDHGGLHHANAGGGYRGHHGGQRHRYLYGKAE
jgi:hypothetical protein